VLFAANSVLTTIADRAFSGCFELKSLCVPASVTRIAEKCFLDCNFLTIVQFAAPSRIRELLDLPPHVGPIDVPDSVEELVLSGDSDGRSGWTLNFGPESRLRRIQIMPYCFITTQSGEHILSGNAWIEHAEWSKDPEHPKRAYYAAHGTPTKRELVPKGFLRFSPRLAKQVRAEREFELTQAKAVPVTPDPDYDALSRWSW
jgi:hypothetical protein